MECDGIKHNNVIINGTWKAFLCADFYFNTRINLIWGLEDLYEFCYQANKT